MFLSKATYAVIVATMFAFLAILPHKLALGEPQLKLIEFRHQDRNLGFVLVLQRNETTGLFSARGSHGGLYFGDLTNKKVDRLAGVFQASHGEGEPEAYRFAMPEVASPFPFGIVLESTQPRDTPVSFEQAGDFVLRVGAVVGVGDERIEFFDNDPIDAPLLAFMYHSGKYTLHNHNYHALDRTLWDVARGYFVLVERNILTDNRHEQFTFVMGAPARSRPLAQPAVVEVHEPNAAPSMLQFVFDGGSQLEMSKIPGTMPGFLNQHGERLILTRLELNRDMRAQLGYDDSRITASDWDLCAKLFAGN